MKQLILCALLAFVVAFAAPPAPEDALEGVLELTSDNVDSEVLEKTNVATFVEFYAPWCGHCKRLARDFAELAEIVAKTGEGKIELAKIDASRHPDVKDRFKVTGFPTLLLFKAGASKTTGKGFVEFQSTRTAEEMMDFLNAEVAGAALKDEEGLLEAKKKEEDDAEKDEEELTTYTHTAFKELHGSNQFNKVIRNRKKATLVFFYRNNCRYCKEIFPRAEAIAEAFVGEPEVVMARMDMANPANKDILDQHGINYAPYFMYFPWGSTDANPKVGEEYKPRTDKENVAEEIIEWVNERAKTQRQVGGLKPGAYTDPTLDQLANEFGETFTHSYENENAKRKVVQLRHVIHKRVEMIQGKCPSDCDEDEEVFPAMLRNNVKVYATTVDKMIKKQDPYYARNEISRVSRMMKGGNVTPKSRDAFAIKISILEKFANYNWLQTFLNSQIVMASGAIVTTMFFLLIIWYFW